MFPLRPGTILSTVAITLLAAGTAAAAAGGALPMFEQETPKVVVHNEVDRKPREDLAESNEAQSNNDDSSPVTQPSTVVTVLIDAYVDTPLRDDVPATTDGTPSGTPSEETPAAAKPPAAPTDDTTAIGSSATTLKT